MNQNHLYETITARILAALEQGVKPWTCPWDRTGSGPLLPWNPKTGHPYRGVNIVLLWLAAQDAGFSSTAWLTLKQANALGGKVRKGEKSTVCYFFKRLDVERQAVDEATGETVTVSRDVPLLKAFRVFNLAQIDGIELPTRAASIEFSPIEAAEALLIRSGARIKIGGTRACYSPIKDEIHLPDRHRFRRAEDFYATANHELVHHTGHSSRLARDFSGRFGDAAYAFEELVAEIGSAFLNADLNLQGDLQHESYLAHWLKILKEDKRAIVKAASLASQAHRFLVERWQGVDEDQESA